MEDGNTLLSHDRRNEKPCIPYRYYLTLMMFFGFFNAMTSRYCLNIAIVAMVRYNETSANSTSDECPAYPLTTNSSSQIINGEFNWGPETQSILLAAFFYGYVFTQLPGGYLAEQFGAKYVFGCAIFVPSLLSLVTPFVARWSSDAFIVLRIVMGVFEGPLFPSGMYMIGVWSPPMERTQMNLLSTVGSAVGTIVAQFLTGYLSSLTFLGGWPLPFYVFGASGIVWFVIWVIFAQNNPREHMGLSTYERNYILSSLGDSNKQKTAVGRPWCKILFSKATLALHIFSFFDGLAYNGYMSGFPIYLKQILRFDVKQNGDINALSQAGMTITALGSGFLADWLRRNHLSTTTTRKLFAFISEFTLAVCTLGVTFVECNREAALALFLVSLTIMGFGGAGAVSNPLDIAPAYTGSVVGVANLFANIGGFLSPMMIGYVTDDSTNIKEWRQVFLGMSACYFVAIVVYMILGTGEEQSWARQPGDSETEAIEYIVDEPQHSVNEAMREDILDTDERALLT